MSTTHDSRTGMDFHTANPGDKGVFAEFYLYPELNNFKTEQEGRPIYVDKIYIRIRTPGDRLSEVDREAKDQDKQRFPFQWARFEQGTQQAESGTPLEEWPLMTPATIRTYKAMNIFNVEGLAAVSDGNLQKLGPGARVFRDQAIAYLERAAEGAGTRQLAAENKDLRAELEALKLNMADLAAAVRRKEAKDED